MKKLSGVAVVTTAEGERVSYTYMELDDSGNITSQNNRGSFVALDEEVLAERVLGRKPVRFQDGTRLGHAGQRRQLRHQTCPTARGNVPSGPVHV